MPLPNPPVPPEPDGPGDIGTGRRPWARAAAIGAAVLLSALAALFAPGEWAPGPGSVIVFHEGEEILAAPVEVGSGDAIRLARPTGDDAVVEVVFADGVPVHAPIRATLRVLRAGRPMRVDTDDVTVSLRLADGETVPIPVVRWDAREQQIEAFRRPPVRAGVVLGLLGFVVVLWVTEAFPLFVTSLLVPVVLVVSGVSSAIEATSPFFHPIIVLFLAGFLMAEAMRRTGLDRRVALSLVARAGRSPTTLFAALLGVAAFASMWMSNTAATALLVPIALAISEPLRHQGYRKALVLGIAYAATIGGVGSAIGTPANQIAIEFLAASGGREIGFAEWFLFGLPMVALLLPVIGLVVWRRSRVDVDPANFQRAREVAVAARRDAGPAGRDHWIVVAVFCAVVAAWLTQTHHGVHAGIIALAGAVVLALAGTIRADDLQRISWASLITFGGGLTLGLALEQSGVSDWVADGLGGLAGWPGSVAVAGVALLALGLTTVASNTASAAILIPLAIPLARVLGVDPVLLVAVVAVASSIDFALVIGSPPTMIAYSTKLYTAREIFGTGVVLDLVGIGLLVTVVIGIWRVLGVV